MGLSPAAEVAAGEWCAEYERTVEVRETRNSSGVMVPTIGVHGIPATPRATLARWPIFHRTGYSIWSYRLTNGREGLAAAPGNRICDDARNRGRGAKVL